MSYLLSAISNNVIYIAIGVLLFINILLTIRLQKSIKQNKGEDSAVMTDSAVKHIVNNNQDGNEVVAAITAAVAAILDAEAVQQGKQQPKFIVRQIKKKERY